MLLPVIFRLEVSAIPSYLFDFLSHLKKDLRARVFDYEMENYVSQLSNKSLYSQRPKVIHRFPNLTQQDFHIDASFDGIRETGFWANGSEISNEWWFRNSDYETNVSNSILLDQVRLLNSLNLGVPRLSIYRFYLSPMSKINWQGQFLWFRYIMILLSGILKYRGPRKRCFNSQGQVSLQGTFCV